MRRYFILSSLTIGVLLSGCAAPDSIHPKNTLFGNNILAHSQSLNADSLSSANWPQEAWWQHFGDQNLNTLINEALKNSPDMQLATARLSQADAQVAAADSLFDPTLNANASMSRSRLSRIEDYSGQGNRFGTSRDLGLNFNYSFDLWGGKRAAWEASVNNLKAAEVDQQAARIALSSGITQTYVQLANAYALEDLAKKDLDRNQHMVEITTNLYKNGLTSEDRLYAAQSSAASAKQTLKQRTLAVAQLKNALAALVGTGPDKAASIGRPNVSVQADFHLPSDLPAALISHRPDITAARWRVEAASKQIDVAKTRFYPNFNLSAMAGFKSVLGDAVFADVSRSWNVTPAISLPIFTADLKANLLSKTADYDTAVAQYNQTLIRALNEVSDNVLALKSVEQQLVDAKDSMDLAEKSYQITEKRYQAGMGSQLEVLMAEQQVLQAESVFTSLKNHQQETQVQLIQSLGGGFSTPASAPTQHIQNN
jgi:efflux transporter, outer membrane factor (OMF) lipoprotein, NodT family